MKLQEVRELGYAPRLWRHVLNLKQCTYMCIHVYTICMFSYLASMKILSHQFIRQHMSRMPRLRFFSLHSDEESKSLLSPND